MPLVSTEIFSAISSYFQGRSWFYESHSHPHCRRPHPFRFVDHGRDQLRQFLVELLVSVFVFLDQTKFVLPFAGESRRLQGVGLDAVDQVQSLFGGNESLFDAFDVSSGQQGFDDRRSRGRSSDTLLLIASRSSSSSTVFPQVSIALSKEPSVYRCGGLVRARSNSIHRIDSYS